MTQRRVRAASGSGEQLRAFSKKVLVHNLLLGWWGFPFGLIWTPVALFKNSQALSSLKELESTGRAAPGWHRDPTGRHAARYWDGSEWTEHVSDVGKDSVAAPTTAADSLAAPAGSANGGTDSPVAPATAPEAGTTASG